MRHTTTIAGALLLLATATAAEVRAPAEPKQVPDRALDKPYTAYLMAYFGPQEKLFYAFSRDARNWEALNAGRPVFDAKVRLRDPFLNRVGDMFHLVHTKGWDHPTIFHWESADLINWKGGPIDVVPPDRKRAWAPEFFYEKKTGLFHVFWASIHNGHNTMHVVTTRDWSDITPDRAQVFYDIGIHDIDLTIVEFDGVYYGFHKPGDVGDRMGNRLSTSRTLDPQTNTFAEGRPGKIVFDGQTKPTEGPEVIQLIGQNKWYVYGDPFDSPMEAWETSDFVDFKKIMVKTVPGSKHCSMLPITETELIRLRETYPDPCSALNKAKRGITTLLPHAKEQPCTWRYTLQQPGTNWFKSGFDDSQWQSGKGGFGTRVTPNTAVGTVWDTEEIWLRRSFTIDRLMPGEVYLELHHDEDTIVYLNGVQAVVVTWYNTGFELVPVVAAAAKTLKPGENTIAVHCRQTTGGQYIDVGLVTVKEDRWSRAKAWKWYKGQPWPCGFNYIPANAINYIEMWMPYAYDTELIDNELALAEETGFNCLRVFLPFVVWEHDPDAFKKRLESFLSICDNRGIKVMFTLFDDCAFGSDEKLENPTYGRQPQVLEGWYANGWTPSPGHDMVRDPKTWPRLEKYVKDVISTFKDDRRVWVWDLYNEPRLNLQGDVSVPLFKRVFAWGREVNPSQPLTVGQWNDNPAFNAVKFQNSDIVTFHDYNAAGDLAKHIESLKQHGRPIINTEWLNRGRGSLVETCLPVFAREKVGCIHWGLVNGKTQTHLNWGHRPGQPDPPAWQHDLYHQDHRPYNTAELKLFRKTIRESVNRWSSEKGNAWYAKHPWLVGCNFIPSTAINQLEMWQADTFDPETIDRELGWAAKYGFNSVRVFVNYVVYQHEPEELKKRIDKFLSIADRHGISTMMVLLDDVAYWEPVYGKQPDPRPGLHNSQWVSSPGASRTVPEYWPRLKTYVQDIVGSFGQDSRILVWDLYNEAKKSNRSLVVQSFLWAREMNPMQPLTSCWQAEDISDVITFHHYGNPPSDDMLEKLTSKRPVICTECIARTRNNKFSNVLPQYAKHQVGWYMWGLVKGRTQTYQVRPGKVGDKEAKLWFHDLLHQDGSPYNPEEIKRIREYVRQYDTGNK